MRSFHRMESSAPHPYLPPPQINAGSIAGKMAIAASALTFAYAHPFLSLTYLFLAAVVSVVLYVFGPSRNTNPFREDSVRPPSPLVREQASRDRVLKQGKSVSDDCSAAAAPPRQTIHGSTPAKHTAATINYCGRQMDPGSSYEQSSFYMLHSAIQCRSGRDDILTHLCLESPPPPPGEVLCGSLDILKINFEFSIYS